MNFIVDRLRQPNVLTYSTDANLNLDDTYYVIVLIDEPTTNRTIYLPPMAVNKGITIRVKRLYATGSGFYHIVQAVSGEKLDNTVNGTFAIDGALEAAEFYSIGTTWLAMTNYP